MRNCIINLLLKKLRLWQAIKIIVDYSFHPMLAVLAAHMAMNVCGCLPIQELFDHLTFTLADCKHKWCVLTLCVKGYTIVSIQSKFAVLLIAPTWLMRSGSALLRSNSSTTCSCPCTTAMNKGVVFYNNHTLTIKQCNQSDCNHNQHTYYVFMECYYPVYCRIITLYA